MTNQETTKGFMRQLSPKESLGITSHKNPRTIVLEPTATVADHALVIGDEIASAPETVLFLGIKQQSPNGKIHNGIGYVIDNTFDVTTRAMESGQGFTGFTETVSQRISQELTTIKQRSNDMLHSVFVSKPSSTQTKREQSLT